MKNTPRTRSAQNATQLAPQDARTVTKMRVRAATKRRGPVLMAFI